jgi:hypothetical protein
MRSYRATKGPFAERPVYSQQEVEELCADELRKAGLYPSTPSPVRIERFIEKRFSVSPIYEDLPDGLLGYTKFGSKGVESIVVAKSLTDDSSKVASRRVNTTLAHEAGHGLLHAHLFAVGAESAASLFDGNVDAKSPKILCRPDGVPGIQNRSNYDGRWWEFQANLTIGALLLPKPLVEECLSATLTSTGLFGVKRLEPRKREAAVKLVSDTFDVNPVVARIRVEQLYPEKQDRQLTL